METICPTDRIGKAFMFSVRCWRNQGGEFLWTLSRETLEKALSDSGVSGETILAGWRRTKKAWPEKIKAILNLMPGDPCWARDDEAFRTKADGAWVVMPVFPERTHLSYWLWRVEYWTDDFGKGEFVKYGQHLNLEWAIEDAIIRSYIKSATRAPGT